MTQIISWIFDGIISIVGALLEGVFDFIKSLGSHDKPPEHDAKFADPSELLSSRNTGFTFGNVSLDRSVSFRNAIIYGNTGSGKNVSVLIPSLLRMAASPCSMIVNDPSKQLWSLCSGALKKSNIRVMTLNFADPTKGGWNPLTLAKSTSAIKKLCRLLIHSALGQSKDPYWNLAAMDLLSVMIRIVQHLPVRERNMASVVALLNRLSYAPEDVDWVGVQTNDLGLISDLKTYASYEPKMLNSIIATCRAGCSIFTDPQVALCTAYDTIDFDELRTIPTVIFLHSSIPDMKYYSVLTSIFCEQAFGQIMAEVPPDDALPIFFLLDESSSLSLSATLPNTYSNIRKYKGGILSVYQSPFQLVELFTQPGARALEENAFARLYLPGVNIATATELENTLGKTEFIDKEGVRRVMPLMSASHIRLSDSSLLICNNRRAMRLQLKPFYEQRRLKKLTELPSYQSPNTMPFNSVPTIQFS